MKISKIKLKNIKSFKESVEIEFNDDFNILIGPNGSGKSNLLDILTICMRQYFLKPCIIEEGTDNQGFFRKISQRTPFSNINQVLDKFYGDLTESTITIDFVIKKEDIANINNIKSNVDILNDILLSEFRNGNDYRRFIDNIKNWDANHFTEDEKIVFIINNNNLTNEQNAKKKCFLEYLNLFEFILILIRHAKEIELHTNYLYFSPYRGANLQNLQANLSNQNFYQVLQTLMNTTSKSVFSLINLATIYFAEKRRGFEDDATNEGYVTKWDNDKEVQLVSKYLGKLGYGWNLKLVDRNKNIYEILLTKEGKEFYVNQASSGEKEIINFLLGVFAFNLNNGVIIIDEPELHLHPRWQNVLLDLFIELSSLTKNQFILSTHSPTFINDKSYNHIFRVYKNENNISKAITLKDYPDFCLKDILHIVNSTNNEKLFFADVVILVEGITDRLVFQKILISQMEKIDSTKIVEIVEIKGKSNIEIFRNFLSKLQIPTFFISDLDYVNEIGTAEIKGLFQVNKKKIADDVIKNPKSKDGESLVNIVERFVVGGNFEDIRDVWEYIKSFRRKLKPNLNPDEKKLLDNFIVNQFNSNNIILSRGDIEDYFPTGYKDKNLTKVIDLLQGKPYDEWVKMTEYKELEKIIDNILIKSKTKIV